MRITLNDFDFVRRYTEHAGSDLGKTRRVTLSRALRAAKDRRARIGMDDHPRAFVTGSPEPDCAHRHRRCGA